MSAISRQKATVLTAPCQVPVYIDNETNAALGATRTAGTGNNPDVVAVTLDSRHVGLAIVPRNKSTTRGCRFDMTLSSTLDNYETIRVFSEGQSSGKQTGKSVGATTPGAVKIQIKPASGTALRGGDPIGDRIDNSNAYSAPSNGKGIVADWGHRHGTEAVVQAHGTAGAGVVVSSSENWEREA